MAREDLAPSFQIAVAGSKLGTGVTDFVSQVAVEFIDGAIWAAEIEVEDSADLKLIASKVFAWGNEIDVWFGYGAKLTHMGRFVVARLEPNFPADGTPQLSVKAYAADYRMTQNAPEGGQGRPVARPKSVKVTKKAKKGHGRAFEDKRFDDAVFDVTGTYGFLSDIDEVSTPPSSFNQVVGQSDYDFVRGLANLSGFLFWVDGDENGQWTAHFRDPEAIYHSLTGIPVQKEKFTFRYAAGDFSTLLSFQPEGAIAAERTRLRVAFKDPLTGKLVEEEIDEEGDTPDIAYEGAPTDKVQRGPDSGGAVRVFFGDYSIETVADRQFKSGAEAKAWAAQWFRRNRENFQMGRGRVVGVESLRCFQIHALDGIGPWSGDWYFARARHVMSRESGYLVDFHARKVVR